MAETVHLTKKRPLRRRGPLKDVQISLGRRIRSLRLAKGLTQEAMETKGLNYKYYQRIEAGRCNLTLKTLYRIAAALGVKVEDLFRFPLEIPQDRLEEEVIGLITRMIGKKERAALKKLRIFLVEILNQIP